VGPGLVAAELDQQPRPRRAAELLGQPQRVGIFVKLGVDQDDGPVIELEAHVVVASASQLASITVRPFERLDQRVGWPALLGGGLGLVLRA